MIRSLLTITFFTLISNSFAEEKKKPDILFIGIDDLRPELGCYGSEIAISPHIDELAEKGLMFNQAHCQQAICGPSRASLLTGTRPESNGIYHNYVKIRELNPDIVTLPQYFGSQGYKTVYTGKIFHHGDLDPVSWNTEPAEDMVPEREVKASNGFALEENQEKRAETSKEMFEKYGDVARFGLAMGPAYESADVPDNTYSDGHNTDVAIATLKRMVAEGDRPFFLGLGFDKPHLNWIATKKYWDLYKRDEIPTAQNETGPEGGAKVGLHPSFELRVRAEIPKIGEFDPELERTLMHSYLACISYVDAQVGRMIAALEEAGVRDNTIIILWSDHGFHLGDMGIWGKATNYEIATRVPMMIWTPDMPAGSRGKTTDALVELVDMYPTLCELAGIEMPDGLEGTSLVPLLENPEQPWKTAAFSQFPSPALREWGAFPIRPAMRETYFGPLLKEVEDKIIDQVGGKWDRDLFENNLMGQAMRTDSYRIIAWQDTENPDAEPIQLELYDHKTDPSETKNIADENPEVVAKLLSQLKAGWKGSLPPETSGN
ncbi:MAG: sulfatase [Luteolibacter sp.]